VVAVAAAADIDGPPVVIGHSMGGFVTIGTAALHGDLLAGVIVCDSPVTKPDPEVESYRLNEAFGRPRTYESVEQALTRFRTVPPQDHYLDYVIDHVARRSLKPMSDIAATMYDALGRVAPVIELPEAGHHAMLDQPLVLLTALRALLADWDHSDPHRKTH
jgi:pimeloyl-ACP methyl ester carboxylesterase